MNRKGSAIIQLLIILVVVVLTSSILLFLMSSGIIKTKSSDLEILNSEFIPLAREGKLSINNFAFCQEVDVSLKCLEYGDVFRKGDRVFFEFEVETTPYQGEVAIFEMYRILGPDGDLVLDFDARDDFYFNTASDENIFLVDNFLLGSDLERGEYTLELVVKNSLLNLEEKEVKRFVVG